MSTATSDAGDIDDDVATGGGAIEVGPAPTFAVSGTGEELRPSTAASRVSFAPDVEVHEGKSGSGVGDMAADEGGKTDASSESTATADVHDESKNGTSGAGAGAGAGSGVPDMTDHMIEHLADPKCVCRLVYCAHAHAHAHARAFVVVGCVRTRDSPRKMLATPSNHMSRSIGSCEPPVVRMDRSAKVPNCDNFLLYVGHRCSCGDGGSSGGIADCGNVAGTPVARWTSTLS